MIKEILGTGYVDLKMIRDEDKDYDEDEAVMQLLKLYKLFMTI